VGDGTTTVVLLAAEFLKACKGFVEEGVHPQGIIRSYRQAAQLAVAHVRELSVDIGGKDVEERKQLLEKCAQTSLNSKLVRFPLVGCCAAYCGRTIGLCVFGPSACWQCLSSQGGAKPCRAA
jgi:chaperonin GroEL (HSP60 family)